MSTNTSVFDPASFLDATIDTPLVKRPPLPTGDYTGIIGEVKARAWQGKADPSKSGIAWDVPIAIEIPAEVQAELGIELSTLTISDSIMLDLTENGTIDQGVGKNRRLRLYREAVDMNKPGDSFSARKLMGQPIRLTIKHELYNDEIQERIGNITRA